MAAMRPAPYRLYILKRCALSSNELSIDATSRVSGRDTASLWPLVLCYAGMVAIAIAVNLPPVYLTTFSQTFGGAAGLNDQQLGMIGTLIFVGLVAGLLVSGPLADRLGARTFVLLGSALIGSGLGIMAWAPSYEALLFAACFMGVGAGVMDMILSPIVAALRPEHRTSAMNWLHAFYSIGAVVTTLIAALMIRLSVHWPIFGWRYVFAGLAVVPAIVLLGFLKTPVPPLVAENKERTSSRTLLSSGAFWIALFAMTLAGTTELGMAQWLPAYAERGLAYPKWAGGLALTGFSVAMAIGRLGGGVVSRHVRPARMLMGSCAICAVLYLVGAFCPIPAIALAGCVMLGLAVSCLWPTTLGITADRFPHGGATMFALLAAFGNAGGWANMVIGSVADQSSLRVALGSMAICPLLMAGLLMLGSRLQGTADGR